MDFSSILSFFQGWFASEHIIELTLFVAIIAFLTGIAAGFVDSTVGGGGLVAFPMLLFLGIPPHNILATNKLQSCVGTVSSVYHFKKKGFIDMKKYFPLAFFLTVFWAIVGVFVLKNTSVHVVEKIIPVVMCGILIYKVVHFKHGMVAAHKPLLGNVVFIVIFSALLGFYDGFFGPGVGSLWIFAFITFTGMDSLHASANTKLLNLASNIGSLLVFVPSGMICFKIAFLMGVGQVFGAKFGVYVSIKKGSKFINILFIMVMVVLVVRLFSKFYL
jgi:uncharacterized membrane protein YfcA